MPMTGAIIVSYPPFIIPTVGRGREREVQDTTDACRAALLRERGLVNVLVTNGTIEEVPWREPPPFIDAANIKRKKSPGTVTG